MRIAVMDDLAADEAGRRESVCRWGSTSDSITLSKLFASGEVSVMDFSGALTELYPTCKAFYFPNCVKFFLAEDVRGRPIPRGERFFRFGVKVRFFNIQGTEDMMGNMVGMNALFLPDLQYHFHGMALTGRRIMLTIWFSIFYKKTAPFRPVKQKTGLWTEKCARIFCGGASTRKL